MSETAQATCARCSDTGAYSTTETTTRGQFISTSHITHPCACRERISPRGGDAAWWSLETVLSTAVDIPIGAQQINVSVRAEVPMSRDNFRVHRHGNRYYPTLIDVAVGDESLSLHAETARELAAALIAAAEASEAIDKPDTDTCGHWAPCDCRAQERTP
jgi:hypothetical protein